jgi:hypothetical protein
LDLVIKSNNISRTLSLKNKFKYDNLIILSDNFNLEKIANCTVVNCSIEEYINEYSSIFSENLFIDDRLDLNININSFLSKFRIQEYDLLVPLTYGDTISLIFSQIIGNVRSCLPAEWNPNFIDYDILDGNLWLEFKNQKCKNNINDFKIDPNFSKYLLIAWRGTSLERNYMSPKFLANYDSNCHNIA